MFLHVSVCPQGAWYPACLAGFQAHTRGEVEGSGQGGLQAHTWGGEYQHALRQTPPHLMATVAGSTHPTRMHSCYVIV